MAPSVMNLRVRTWMAYECKIPNYIDMPTRIGLITDVFMLISALVGVGCTIWGFGGVFTLSESGSEVRIEVDSFDNIIAFCLAILSGILLGIGLGQVRILCSFKMVREKLMQ